MWPSKIKAHYRPSLDVLLHLLSQRWWLGFEASRGYVALGKSEHSDKVPVPQHLRILQVADVMYSAAFGSLPVTI
jgi:hypothetical protein